MPESTVKEPDDNIEPLELSKHHPRNDLCPKVAENTLSNNEEKSLNIAVVEKSPGKDTPSLVLRAEDPPNRKPRHPRKPGSTVRLCTKV